MRFSVKASAISLVALCASCSASPVVDPIIEAGAGLACVLLPQAIPGAGAIIAEVCGEVLPILQGILTAFGGGTTTIDGGVALADSNVYVVSDVSGAPKAVIRGRLDVAQALAVAIGGQVSTTKVGAHR